MNRILCVDDDVSFQRSLKAMLKDSNYLESKYSIQDAVSILEKETFDLIVLDHALPDGEGWEFIKQLQNPQHNIPVVVLSGYSTNSIKDQYSKWEQVRNILSKPLYPEMLQTILKEVEQYNNKTQVTVPYSIESIIDNYSFNLKNDLTVLCGLFELYYQHLHTEKDRELKNLGFECIHKINQACDELPKAVKQFIQNNQSNNSQIQTKIKPVNYADLISDIKTLLSNTIQVNNIHFIYEEHNASISTDYHKLKQICFYLIQNACQRLQSVQNGKIQVTIRKNKPYHFIQIADNGTRIPEPYFKTRKSIFNDSAEPKEHLTSVLSSLYAMGWDLETYSSGEFGNIVVLKIPLQTDENE